jgi:hypothetical protein
VRQEAQNLRHSQMPVAHGQYRYQPNEYAIFAAAAKERGNAEAVSHEN